MNFKKFYKKIKKEHIFIFLIILTTLVLFNYFNFGYTGSVIRDTCYNQGYSCCSPGSGNGNYYFSLDNTCSQGDECWDSCQVNQANLVTTKASFFDSINNFFGNIKNSFNKFFGKEIVGAQCSNNDDCKDGERCIVGKCVSTPLILNVGVNGPGTVSGDSNKINCPSDCTETYAIPTTVTLTADPSIGTFNGDCSGIGSCNVNVNKANTQVIITFPATQSTYILMVNKEGQGTGTIRSIPSGINDCRDFPCGAIFSTGVTITLIAIPDADSKFDGWGGACQGSQASESCTLNSINSNTGVIAKFSKISSSGTYTINVNIIGKGIINSYLAGGIYCGVPEGKCTGSVFPGSDAMLIAEDLPQTEFTFSNWGGNCYGTQKTCTLTVDSNKQVTAIFKEPTPYYKKLIVIKQGQGTVISNPSGIDCGNSCSNSYNQGTRVVLTASPNQGYKFDGWEGDCEGSNNQIIAEQITTEAIKENNFFNNIIEFFRSLFGKTSVGTVIERTCIVNMDSDKQVVAKFSLILSPEQYTLSVTKPSNGKIISNDQKIKCGGIWPFCQTTYTKGASVTITAIPNPTYSFARWGNDCSGFSGSTCNIILDVNKQVTAIFETESATCTPNTCHPSDTTKICNQQGNHYVDCAEGKICLNNQCITQVCSPGTLKQNTQCLVCNPQGTAYSADNSKCLANQQCNAQGQCVISALSIPIAPSNLQAIPISTSQIKLNWQDKSNNEEGFKIEGKTKGIIVAEVIGNTFTEIAIVNANANTYTVSNLNSGKEYEFRIRAYNDKGNSAYSNTATAMTLLTSAFPQISLVNPINAATNVNTNTDINLSFSQSMDKSSVQSAFSLKDVNNNLIAGKFLWTEQDKKLTFIPNSLLTKNKQYNIKITTSAKNINNIYLQNEFNSVFTTIPEVKGEDDYTNGCNNNIDDDNDGIYDGLDKDCATGEKVIIKSITVQDTRPFEDSEFEIQCKIEVFGQTATLYRAQPCIIANLSTKTTSELCEFKKASGEVLRFNCDAGPAGLNKVASCEVDINKCNGDLQDQSKNKAQKFINVVSPDLCERIIGQERVNIVSIDLNDNEYKAGNKIKPRLEIENLDNQDLELEVGAYLYNINSKEQLLKNTTTRLIEEGLDSEEVNLVLITPKVPKSKYKLYFKVSLKDDEDEICILDNVNIDIKPSTDETTCQDRDNDGYTALSCGGKDCDDNDEDINPAAMEICSDLLDNNCDNLIDLDDPMCTTTCMDEETKECGLNIGICKKGVQTCSNGQWGDCIGEIKPTQEICDDRLDNNCNGLTDCSDSSCTTFPSCDQVGEKDRDKDGLPDDWELKYFETLDQNADDDYDEDGFTNAQEYSKGTDPTDPDDFQKESKFFLTLIIIFAVIIIAVFLVWLFAFRPKRPAPDLIDYQKKLKSYAKGDQNVNVTLSDYIKNSLRQGYTRQQIKNALIMKGWNEKDIEEAFKYR